MARSAITINKLKAENERLKSMLSTATMFWDVVYHLNMKNWEPALKARIESLTHDNKQLDDAYAKARALLDKELAEMRAKNTQLEKEADWLAERLSTLDFLYNREATTQAALPKTAEEWRITARDAVLQQNIKDGAEDE